MGNSFSADGRAPVRLFASDGSWIEGNARAQLEKLADLAGVRAVAGMPDLHLGKFGPVGCAILADRLYPRLVGSDIGCGMGLFRLDLSTRKLRLDKLAERIRVLDEPWRGDASAALDEAGLTSTGFEASLGTIGGGNHFCEVQAIEEILEPEMAARAGLEKDAAYMLVHSGSRGFGHSILERCLADGAAALDPHGEAGEAYLAEHDRAVRWARLNRRIIAERTAEAARSTAVALADLSHNMLEVVDAPGGGRAILHRKGAAPSDRGLVPIPGSRGTLSYLVEPLSGRPEALASLAHGAGRKYDRASMHGRVRTKKSDLARLVRNPFGGLIVCEDRDLLVEEAPDAYKSVERVIGDLASFGLARPVASFRPLLTFKVGTARSDGKRRDRRDGEDRR